MGSGPLLQEGEKLRPVLLYKSCQGFGITSSNWTDLSAIMLIHSVSNLPGCWKLAESNSLNATDPSKKDPALWFSEDDAFWALVASKTDALIAAWDTNPGEGASLSNLISDVPPQYRRAMICELVKVDLEMRWRDRTAGEPLEFYLGRFPEIADPGGVPVDLIYEEYQIRNAAGNRVSRDEIFKRFPSQIAQFDQLAGTGMPSFDSSLPATQLLRDSDVQLAPLVEGNSLDQFSEGDLVDDFDLLLSLGSGTFARVFLARQRSLERLVALKIASDESREPRTLAQLDHPNIVRVYDQRQLPKEKLRLLYMELVPGGTLQEVIGRMGRGHYGAKEYLAQIDETLIRVGSAPPVSSILRRDLLELPWPLAVCQLGAQLADGLAYAHEKGVLHRDIKPANVLLSAEGAPKLADFNISFNAAGRDERPSDTFGGSLAYMSPEQLRACHATLEGHPEDVGEASDIYSLGLVLLEVVSGRRIFKQTKGASDWEASLQKMLRDREVLDIERVSDTLPSNCPDSFREVALSCLAMKPQDRPRTAGVLATRLRLCLRPRLWRLLRGPQSRWAQFFSRYPLTLVFLVTMLPMVPVALFNFAYNRGMLATRFPDVLPLFDRVQFWINSIGFPAGIAIGVLLAYRAIYRWPHPAAGRRGQPTPLLNLGRNLAALSISLWLISGLTFPASLHWGTPAGADPLIYTLFILTLTLCGLIAGTYPYLFVNFLSVRLLLPGMLRRGATLPDARELDRARKITRLFVSLTAVVPMLAILLAVLFRSEQQLTLIVLSIAGLIGFLIALPLGREMDEDLGALQFMDDPLAESWEPS